MEGTVKWFDRKKGYGFIASEDGEDYFVHYTSLPKGAFLRENDVVSFEAAETDKGKQAKTVVLKMMGSAAKGGSKGSFGKKESKSDDDSQDSQEESEDFGDDQYSEAA